MKNTDRPTSPADQKLGITSLSTYAENPARHEERAMWALQRDVENRGYEFDKTAVVRRTHFVRMGDDQDQYEAVSLYTFVR